MELSEEEFRKFAELIYRVSGIRLQESKKTLLTNRLRRRLKALGLGSYEAYYRHLTAGEATPEMDDFLDAVTTNETSFFRTPAHFDWFKGEFLSECSKQALRGERARELRIWSAACSTGEEPYSIAICLLENQLKLAGWKLRINGSDLSGEVLQQAREGTYPESALEVLTEKQRQRYFIPAKVPRSWTPKTAVTSLVSFQKHHLLTPWKGEQFDCIFLRNVLIYFDRESKMTALRHVRDALKPRGFLVLGPSEGAFDLMQGFEKLSTFLYRRQDS